MWTVASLITMTVPMIASSNEAGLGLTWNGSSTLPCQWPAIIHSLASHSCHQLTWIYKQLIGWLLSPSTEDIPGISSSSCACGWMPILQLEPKLLWISWFLTMNAMLNGDTYSFSKRYASCSALVDAIGTVASMMKWTPWYVGLIDMQYVRAEEVDH